MPQPLTIAVLRPVRQRKQYDCSVAAIATLIGIDYEVVEGIAHRLYTPKSLRRGFRQYQVRAVLAELGYGVEKLRRPSLDDDTGILEIEMPKITHDTVLFNGCIYDPSDGQLWLAEAYLANHKAAAGSLFVVTTA